MEAAVVKPKPRIRAAVRDGLNRFQLVDEMQTDETKGAAKLKRLTLISRAHLESVRRSARGIKFKLDRSVWRVKLNLGLGAPKIAFPVEQAEMVGIIELLGVPVHLTFDYFYPSFETVDWEELRQIEKYVNALGVYRQSDSPDFSAFISSVAPHLRALHSTWSVLAQLPPLQLERARLYVQPDDFGELNRHEIHRLEVPVYNLNSRSELQSNQVISSSIKSLAILHLGNWTDFPYDSIETFRRRFPSLEDLHIVCEYGRRILDVRGFFTQLWAKCLKIRDRLHVSGLKRLFLTIKQDSTFYGTETDWLEQLKQVEPFDKATVTIDRSNKRVRMFLKHNEPRAAKPTFICIKGDFSCTN
ncbi:hypothetical protein M3Y99_00706900 [Aphelenchoides fujianensis]|nr:hypothetical protein M3Y99_00706900 [Aphelenchoides fujianensis]